MLNSISPFQRKTAFALLGIAVLAVIFVVLFLYAQKRKQPDSTTNNQTQAPKQNIVRTDVATSKIPDKFPADVPIEAGAKITQNYNATTVDGRFQATRAFETAKTLDANFKLYQDWLRQQGWNISATVDQPNYKMLLGSKDNSQLQISLDENTSLKVRTVSINFTELPKQP